MNEKQQPEKSNHNSQGSSGGERQYPNQDHQNKKNKIHSEEMRYKHADDIY
ncbi:hypothetical protein [Bacillus sp. FJAT-27251]|uniref:hypothetical protein n=1 Tax=Bacillus sp. FJAT-27251 TaxID=1684142 RepID=UPI000A544153|nr:hypothetical protein [Bacillus sp. FJAT-27251]